MTPEEQIPGRRRVSPDGMEQHEKLAEEHQQVDRHGHANNLNQRLRRSGGSVSVGQGPQHPEDQQDDCRATDER